MNQDREGILTKVRSANLLPAHVAIWEALIPNISDDLIGSVKQAVEVEPDGVQRMNVLLIDLAAAAKSQDADAWAQAIKEHFERTQELG